MRILRAGAALTCLVAFSAPAGKRSVLAAEHADADPTITFRGRSASVGVGLAWGASTVEFQGKTYPVRADGFVLGGDRTDVQIWIPRDGDPLPQRIVITYRLAEGQPQFEADLGAWNLAPDLPDSLFTFTPAAGAEQIPVLVPRRAKQP